MTKPIGRFFNSTYKTIIFMQDNAQSYSSKCYKKQLTNDGRRDEKKKISAWLSSTIKLNRLKNLWAHFIRCPILKESSTPHSKVPGKTGWSYTKRGSPTEQETDRLHKSNGGNYKLWLFCSDLLRNVYKIKQILILIQLDHRGH